MEQMKKLIKKKEDRGVGGERNKNNKQGGKVTEHSEFFCNFIISKMFFGTTKRLMVKYSFDPNSFLKGNFN